MIVRVYGPNLHGAASGRLHVHSPECKDPARRKAIYGLLNKFSSWDEEIETVQDLVESVYECHIDENPGSTWEDYEDEFDFFPCAGITIRENVRPKEATMTAPQTITYDEAKAEAKRLKVSYDKFLERLTKKGIVVLEVPALAVVGQAAIAAAAEVAAQATRGKATKKSPKPEPTTLLGRAHALRNASSRKLPAAVKAKTVKLTEEELAAYVKGLKAGGEARTWTDAFVLTYWMMDEEGHRVATSEGKIKALWGQS